VQTDLKSHFCRIVLLVRSRPGWPDELVKKVAQNVAQHIFLSKVINIFHCGKNSSKIWAASLIFQNLHKSKQSLKRRKIPWPWLTLSLDKLFLTWVSILPLRTSLKNWRKLSEAVSENKTAPEVAKPV
jgi:hypothetical protein